MPEIDRETDSRARARAQGRSQTHHYSHIDKVMTSGKNRDATTRSSTLSCLWRAGAGRCHSIVTLPDSMDVMAETISVM